MLGTLQGTRATTVDRPHPAIKGGRAGCCRYRAAQVAVLLPSPVLTQTKGKGQVYIHMVQWCYWIFSELQNLDLTQNQLLTGLSTQQRQAWMETVKCETLNLDLLLCFLSVPPYASISEGTTERNLAGSLTPRWGHRDYEEVEELLKRGAEASLSLTILWFSLCLSFRAGTDFGFHEWVK